LAPRPTIVSAQHFNAPSTIWSADGQQSATGIPYDSRDCRYYRKARQRAAILEAFKDNVPAVRAEEGCIEYAAFLDIPGYGPPQAPFGDDTFVIVEKWASVAALKAHAASPHMAAYAARVKDLIASRKVHLLSAA
jgi:quinol monooxygenase YgiN